MDHDHKHGEHLGNGVIEHNENLFSNEIHDDIEFSDKHVFVEEEGIKNIDIGVRSGAMTQTSTVYALTLSRRQLKKNQQNYEKMVLPKLPPLLRYLAKNSFIVVARP